MRTIRGLLDEMLEKAGVEKPVELSGFQLAVYFEAAEDHVGLVLNSEITEARYQQELRRFEIVS